MDAVQVAQESEKEGRLPFIAPMDFRTEYEPGASGEMKPVDWVTWIKKGQQNPSTIECKVVRMPKFYALEWQVLEPAYKRWKEGQTAPIDGTPLAAWPGATPQLVKALEPFSIRSVEDLTRMEDASVSKIAIPGLRGKIQHAKAFLEAQATTSGVSAEVAKLRDENQWLRDELAAIKAAIETQAAGEAEDAPVKRKGGWPLGKPRNPRPEGEAA